MTAKEFFEKLMYHKSKAHTLYEDPQGYKITRGMGHSISGYVEDIFAVFMATNICRTDLIFYVDKVISFRPESGSKAKSFKPDLLILNGNVATHYYDLKTDIGYGRDMKNYLLERNNFILALREKQAWITINKKVEHWIQFSKNIKYSIVIAMDWNVNKNTLKENIEFAKTLPGIEIYVLINEVEKQIAIDSKEFDRLLTDCRNYI